MTINLISCPGLCKHEMVNTSAFISLLPKNKIDCLGLVEGLAGDSNETILWLTIDIYCQNYTNFRQTVKG